MNVKMRQEVERKIVAAVIDGLLADPVLTITVNDGEDDVLKKSRDKKLILKAMFSTDEDIFFIGGGMTGWIKFIYGNDGPDVIHDYTTNLEPYLEAANKVAES